MVIKSSRFHNGRRGAALTVQVIPQADVNELVELLEDGTLSIRLKATLEGGQANNMLVNFLASLLDVDNEQIEIVAGEDGTEKLIAILDIDPDEIQRRIMSFWNRT